MTTTDGTRRKGRGGRAVRADVVAALLLAGAGLFLFGGGVPTGPIPVGEPRLLPAPLVDEDPGERSRAVALLAGGCFWGVQGVYQRVEGVMEALSGYAGGAAGDASYERVIRGGTGHAEAVRITYDPQVISYGEILRIFFSVVHDPTQLDRQGPDIGPHYRSAIFPQDAEQARIARRYLGQLGEARVFDAAIVTRIESEGPFYPAEPYHQDFMVRNPRDPYIVFHDLPKIDHLERFFPDRFRDRPVLVAGR